MIKVVHRELFVKSVDNVSQSSFYCYSLAIPHRLSKPRHSCVPAILGKLSPLKTENKFHFQPSSRSPSPLLKPPSLALHLLPLFFTRSEIYFPFLFDSRNTRFKS